MKRSLIIGLVTAGALTLPVSASADPSPNADQNATICASSSANSTQIKQDRADLFFGGSIKTLQQAHCGS